MTSTVAVYINGRLAASGKLKYPSIPEVRFSPCQDAWPPSTIQL